ncbi:MAG: hypothetical protein ACYDC3_20030 [Candidatus Binataceae bacterium]
MRLEAISGNFSRVKAMRMRDHGAIFSIACAIVFAAAGCSLYQHYKASRPAAVAETESALAEAGFGRMEADYPDQLQMVEGLPSYSMHSYPTPNGNVYWYYDPGTCGCVFEGNAEAFRKYQWELTQQNDIASYVADSEDDDVASLNALNESMFPPSLYLLGMGPIVGGGFFSHGHGGGWGGHHGGFGGRGGGFGGGHGGGGGHGR